MTIVNEKKDYEINDSEVRRQTNYCWGFSYKIGLKR